MFNTNKAYDTYFTTKCLNPIVIRNTFADPHLFSIATILGSLYHLENPSNTCSISNSNQLFSADPPIIAMYKN